MPAELIEILHREAGLALLPTKIGLAAFSRAFGAEQPQVLVLYGDGQKISRLTQANIAPRPAAAPTVRVRIAPPQVEAYLTSLVAELAKLPPEEIDPCLDLEVIGLDSILVTRINTRLAADIGPLPTTLLFEYQSIRCLSAYLIEHHGEALQKCLHRQKPEASSGLWVQKETAVAQKAVTAENPRVMPTSIEKSKSENNKHTHTHTQDIAIIGIHGRYPGAATLANFWENLQAGKDCIGEIPSSRWAHSTFYHPERNRKGTCYGKWGGFIDDVDKFDALFFNISPREAETMDPQERLFLETAWSALEDAGYTGRNLSQHEPSKSQRAVGVYVGVTSGQYEIFSAEAWANGRFVPANSAFWSIANRVSYVLNLRGPSLTVDTACSSSLTAVHLACESIRSKECYAAVAGGVNLNLHPAKYMALSHLQFLSSDGRCRAFGAGGDGYVPGEGVGAVVLKSLDNAIRDRDHIYAVIKASAINHGGKTNGYTVPNPQAQADVIRRALSAAGVKPSEISYVEAHGTGTALGDPIEIAGLSQAFAASPTDRQYCAIGSVKSNIGHLEAAAGIAAVTKVALQLQHQTLVPSLHADELNPRIDFENTPFHVCRKLSPWPAPRPSESNGDTPSSRMAAISSFGAGGANAHIILEEFAETTVAMPCVSTTSPEVVILSARDPERLRIYARALRDHIKQGHPHLPDLAYTLAVGRQAFEERLGLLVRDEKTLVDKLDAFLAGKSEIAGLYHTAHEGGGSQKDKPDVSALFRENRLEELLLLWVKGGDVAWELLYAPDKRRLISLPTYPFRRQRFWIPSGHSTVLSSTQAGTVPHPHPLIHNVIACLEGAEFTCDLTPRTSLLADHKVQGMAVLAGVAHLEMARAAGELTVEGKITALEDVTFVHPVQIPEDGLQLRLRLEKMGANDFLRFEITADSQVRSRGRLRTSNPVTSTLETVDLDEIRARCPRHLDKDEIYTAYKLRGLSYGSYFQRLDGIWFNEEEAIGRVMPNATQTPGDHLYGLHPGVMDAALHTLCAFLPPATAENATMVPFAIANVEIYDTVNGPCHAYTRRTKRDVPETDAIRFDVDIVDEQGRILLCMRDFAVRPIRTKVMEGAGDIAPQDETAGLFYHPVWQETPRPLNEPVVRGQVLVCGHGDDAGLGRALMDYFGRQQTLWVDLDLHYSVGQWETCLSGISDVSMIFFLGGICTRPYDLADVSTLDKIQNIGVIALFRLLRALGAKGLDATRLFVITNDLHPISATDRCDNAFAGTLDGLARTAAREFRHLEVVCLDVTKQDLEDLTTSQKRSRWLSALAGEQMQTRQFGVAWRKNRRFVRRLVRKDDEAANSVVQLRSRGVYILVGGAGGLGMAVGRYLAHNYRARLILIGRRDMDADGRKRMAALEDAGATVRYFGADVTDEAAMQKVVDGVRREFGVIHGVIHSAIVLKDGIIQSLDEKDFLAALAPKVRGSVVLHRVLKVDRLDFYVFFSSSISFAAAPGQSNYVAGCTFKDAFAHALRTREKHVVRIINWGFWGDVGIVSGAAYHERLARNGVIPIATQEGVDAFARIMAQPSDQVMVVKLRPDRIRELGVDVTSRPMARGTGATFAHALSASADYQANVMRQGVDLGDGALERLETVGRERLIIAFQRMGVFCRTGERYLAGQLMADLGIVPAHGRLFHALMNILERAGYVRRDGDMIQGMDSALKTSESERLSVLQEQEAELTREFQDSRAYLKLLSHCLDAYPMVLTGKISAVDLMFPKGRTTLVDDIYQGNRRADYFNRMIAHTVSAMAGRREENAPVRVLEIGAGTGGTSSVVVAALVPHAEHVRYDYTDISPQLVRLGEQRFGDAYNFTTFKVLDIERDNCAQGFDTGAYDIVLATNVLHATTNVRKTLMQIKRLLKPDGVLVNNELTRVYDFVTLTFGLTEGWWRFEDSRDRLPDAPLLAIPAWCRILEETGFYGTTPFGIPGVAEENMDQCVILTQSDGRRPVCAVPEKKAMTMTKTIEMETTAPSPPPPVLQEAENELALHLRKVIAQVLKMNLEELEADVSFERYGVDSLVALDIIAQLEKDFGNLQKDLLFSHTSIDALARYLAAHYCPPNSPPALPHTTPRRTTPRKASVPSTASVRVVPAQEPPGEAVQPMAVVGVSGRFPGSADVEQLWTFLQTQKCAIGEVPQERWHHVPYHDPTGQGAGTSYGKWGAFMQDIDRFDPLLFAISPKEAALMDPQERLFLETAWAVLEDAGYTQMALNRYAEVDDGPGVGVFVGVMYNPYQLQAAERWGQGQRVEAHAAHWSIANRISHVFDFHGPSMAVDTACSSSMTAIHLACESIRCGDCRAAIAGGVNLILHPSHLVGLSKMRMLSHGPHCHAFGEDADGLVPGEGVGAVLIKPLADAIRDHDHIYGVIRATAVNTDGRGQGYAVPNADAQVRVIATALRRAAVEPETVNYLEAQAVGSAMADKIEIDALGRIFGHEDGCIRPIGSLKPNIGHLEAASGIAQLIKVLLQLDRAMLLPTLSPGRINPDLDFTGACLRLQQDSAVWKRPTVTENGLVREGPRRAGISSFGAGGANAHMIVDEAPRHPAREATDDGPHLIVLSARKPGLLRTYAQRLRDFFNRRREDAAGPALRLSEVAYTLQVGREPMAYRMAIVAVSMDELIQGLDGFLSAKHPVSVIQGRALRENQDRCIDVDHVRRRLSEGEAAGLAQEWVQGFQIQWDHVYEGRAVQRIALPGYPFQGERYWMEEQAVVAKPPLSDEAGRRPGPQPAVEAQPLDETEKNDVDKGVSNDIQALQAAVCGNLVELVVTVLSVRKEDLDVDDNFGDYGFSSISLTEFASRIEERFDIEINPTIFFECSTIRTVADYLLEAHSCAVAVAAGMSDSATSQSRPAKDRSSIVETSIGGTMVQAHSRAPDQNGIAVVGMSGIFPNSPDLSSFWTQLSAMVSLIRPIPAGRFDHCNIGGGPASAGEEIQSPWGGFMNGVDQFDAAFFNISPREARLMDPQQRLFLQIVWAAIEDAGIAPGKLSGTRTGIFVGVAGREYAHILEQNKGEIDGHTATGNSHSILANRISYLLNLRGPSEPIDTACSSSLVAVHRAVASIQSGECNLAIAGGVNLLLTPTGFLAFQRTGMLSADGRCKTFDNSADGYVRGEGAGAVILKPLAQAINEGDHIHGVIRATAINHGGRANSLTAPNSAAQSEVIVEAMNKAGFKAETMSYVETHGTGTSLGDPVEFNGLKTAFARLTSDDYNGRCGYCGLGTVKPNIGHLETASGIAGFIKVLLAMKHRTLPGLLNFQELNQHMDIMDSPFYIVAGTRPWQRLRDAQNHEIPRRAGISSFGFGGVNAHVVVEEFESPEAQADEEDQEQVIVLSARSEERLKHYAEKLLLWLTADRGATSACFADMAYTLQLGRDAMDFRLALTACNKHVLADRLRAYIAGSADPNVCFTGNVAKYRDVVKMITDDSAHRRFIMESTAKPQAHRIAALWTKGFDMDWSLLHKAKRRLRIPLPTYPFAMDRYWVEPKTPDMAAAVAPDAPELSEKTSASPPAEAAAQTPGPTSCSTPFGTPCSEETLREEIRCLLAEFLGFKPAVLEDDQLFSAYGVDSIAGLRIMQLIHSRYGDDIAMLTIIRHPTMALFSKYIWKHHVSKRPVDEKKKVEPASESAKQKIAAPQPVISSRQTPSALPAGKIIGSNGGNGNGRKFLVPINKSGHEPPSFWVHTILGDVSYGLNLSYRFGLDYPVYGLEQFDLKGEIHLLSTIEEMAAAYNQTIRKIHSRGTYRIGGYSFGGVVAFEMARQLTQAGETSVQVVMIDSYMPGTAVFEAIDTNAIGNGDFSILALILIANTLGRKWKATRNLMIDDIAEYDRDEQFRQSAKYLHENTQTRLKLAEIEKLVSTNYETIITNNDALLKYTPKCIEAPIPVLLFHSILGFVGPNNPNGLPEVKVTVDDRSNGFKDYVGGELDICDVPADHYTICNDEFIQVVAKKTTRWMNTVNPNVALKRWPIVAKR